MKKWQGEVGFVIVILGLALIGLTRFGGSRQIDNALLRATFGGADNAGPYCGLYCIYAAAKLNGKQVQFKDLLTNTYIHSVHGSSIDDLLRAAKDLGLHALPVANLTSDVLRASPYPIILHTERGNSRMTFNHFVLLLKVDHDEAYVFDPLEPSRIKPLPELTTVCDGLGIAISAGPIDSTRLYAPQRWRFAEWVGIILLLGITARGLQVACVSIMPRIETCRMAFILTAGQFLLILAAASAVGVIANFWSSEGLLAHADTTDWAQIKPVSLSLKDVTFDEVRAAIKERTAVVIDARIPVDYDRGHLPGALNVPVETSRYLRRQIMDGIPADKLIIVYCQSTSCPFAENVAEDLAADGYTNISLYKGGWLAWEQDVNSEAKSPISSRPIRR